MRGSALLGAVVVICAVETAFASPEGQQALVIEITGVIPVSLDKVERALRATMGDLYVVEPAPSDPAGAVARLRLVALPGGQIGVAYRDGAGQEDLEFLDSGPEPAARIARSVTRLRAELRRESRLRRPRRPLRTRVTSSPSGDATARRKTVASPAPRAQPILRLGIAAGVASRRLSIESEATGHVRHVIDGYPFFAFELGLSPSRLASARERSWLWLTIGGQLSPVLHERKRDATTGQVVDVASTHGELHAAFQIDVNLSLDTISPHIGLAIGWSRLAYLFDRSQMDRVALSDQIPSFVYDGPLLAFELDAPIGGSGIVARCGLQGHWVTDLGRDARSMFGLHEGTGGEAHVGLSGGLLPLLGWKVGFSFRGIDLEARTIERPSSSDHLVEVQIAVEYLPE